MLRKLTKSPSAILLFASGTALLALCIAILKGEIAIHGSGNAIPAPGNALHGLGIAIPRPCGAILGLGIALLSLRIAILGLEHLDT